MDGCKQVLSDIITSEAARSEYNSFYALELLGEPMWEPPIIGFASGADAYFQFCRSDIGEFFWTPSEAFQLKFKERPRKDSDLTVVSIAYPQTKATKADQRVSCGRPSARWSVTRGEWEKFNSSVCAKALAEMENIGICAVAIDLLPEFRNRNSIKYGAASSWSHRHAAYAAGLGTFGLSDGLITRRGKAMRFTTIIVDKIVEADARPYSQYNEWCLFYKDETCGECVIRCPVGAISKAGHDKMRCEAYLEHLLKNIPPQIAAEDKSHYYGCGLCQSRIPCEDGIPERAAVGMQGKERGNDGEEN